MLDLIVIELINLFAGAGALVFMAARQAKTRDKSSKKDLLLLSAAVAVAWLVVTVLLIQEILAR